MTVEKSFFFIVLAHATVDGRHLANQLICGFIHLRWLFGISEPSTVGYLCQKKVTGELQQGVDVALWWFMPGLCCSGMLL